MAAGRPVGTWEHGHGLYGLHLLLQLRQVGDAQDHGRLEVVQGALSNDPRPPWWGPARRSARCGASWGCRGRRDRQGLYDKKAKKSLNCTSTPSLRVEDRAPSPPQSHAERRRLHVVRLLEPKVKHETFQNRCGDSRVDTGTTTTGGAGSGYKNTEGGPSGTDATPRTSPCKLRAG